MDNILQTLSDIAVLPAENITLDTSLEALGISDTDWMGLINDMSSGNGHEYSFDDLMQLQTVDDLLDYLER